MPRYLEEESYALAEHISNAIKEHKSVKKGVRDYIAYSNTDRSASTLAFHWNHHIRGNKKYADLFDGTKFAVDLINGVNETETEDLESPIMNVVNVSK